MKGGQKELKIMIFPIRKEEAPYQMVLKIKSGENNLKTTLTEDYFYWRQIFKGSTPVEPPTYSVFRKEINEQHTLHIILLKVEGHKFPRNPNAHALELHCNTKFYGQMAVVFNSPEAPFLL
jgi:hypothetical protein